MRYASLEEQLARGAAHPLPFRQLSQPLTTTDCCPYRAIQAPFPVFATSTCRTAFAVARAAHDGRLAQHSSTGAPALAPPVAAAVRLASLGCDEHTVGACLLFGAVEASPLTEEGLLAAFSPSAPAPRLTLSAARLAAACASASSAVAGAGAATSAAADGAGGAGDDALRSLLLCAAPDVRAVLVLLSSRAEAAKDIPRLHSEAARRAAAHEALAVHAPLAARLGVWPLKTQLEEAAFAVLHPGEAASLAASLAPHGAEEEAACVDAARARLQAALSAAAVPFASVSGRAKSLCSAHRKLRRARLGVAAVAPGSADAVPDARGLRVLAPDEAACRAALAVVRSLWHPVPGRFKDYIASPKPNGYRSLHSLVRDATTGRLLEVQVRTPAMHAAAEGGAASHWLYKASLDKRASGGGGMPAQPPPSPLSASEASFLDAQTSWARFLLSWTPAAAHGAASPPPSPDASSPSSSAAASCAARTPGCVYPLHDASSCSHASPPPPEPDASAAPLLVNVAFGRGAARVLRLPRDCTRAGFKAAAGLPPLPPLPPSPPLHGRSLPHPLAPAVDEPLSNGSRPLLAIVNGLEAGDLLSGPPHGHCGLRPGDVIELAEWRHCGTRGAGATQAAAPQRRRGRSRDFDDAGVDDALRGLLRIAVPA